ncbi:triphosphoribosyl-dephospho-CoA synthase [Streptomyces sp. NPDC052236]|uniref:triphosphoribosyl-dephospho-CoA synthase n=1 Tax=Streptomyces sp. NPDC052236 TaxID=3365686 RepID=UPI0037D7B349
MATMAGNQSDTDEALARAAVAALLSETDLTPKPGLADARQLEALVTGLDLSVLRWSAKSLAPGLAAMASAARRNGEPSQSLREELGSIGRSTEWPMLRAAGGLGTHHGAIWVLGLLVAAAALEPAARGEELTAAAKRIAAFPDRRAPRRPSPGSTVSARYGAAGARGEARAGFPHVRRGLKALRTARSAGTDEDRARLDALLTVMSTLQDTALLHRAGPHELRLTQAGARTVLDAGGTATPEGAEALRVFDADLRARKLRPRGSSRLLAGALFVDGLR